MTKHDTTPATTKDDSGKLNNTTKRKGGIDTRSSNEPDPKRSKPSATSPSIAHTSTPRAVKPPDAGDRLADVLKPEWLQQGMTELQKRHAQALMGFSVGDVGQLPTVLQALQDFVTIDLSNYFLTGNAVPLRSSTTEEEQPNHSENPLQSAEDAFLTSYKDNGSGTAFWDHLETQASNYKTGGFFYPFFAILQSSGYGKSRLLTHLKNNPAGNWTVVYLSFAPNTAFPKRNVDMYPYDLEKLTSEEVKECFTTLFDDAVRGKTKFALRKVELPAEPMATSTTKAASAAAKKVLIAIDEASELLDLFSSNRISFFRCMRRAMVDTTAVHNKCFFVTLGTFASVSQTIPGARYDPSRKAVNADETFEPMESFLLHQTLGLEPNSDKKLLEKTCEQCHDPRVLLSMGRPMWYAFLSVVGSHALTVRDAIVFATGKLLLVSPQTPPNQLNPAQIVALLATRTCITISPTSWLASTLVSSHMATAVQLSSDREELVVSYPSEPMLAIASRTYMGNLKEGGFLEVALKYMKQYFLSGAVPKGHRGEFIVRLLNLLAIDKAMRKSLSSNLVTEEVPLKTFLSEFSRPTHNIDVGNLLTPEFQGSQIADATATTLERMGISVSNEPSDNADLQYEGTVCFTHFVYLSKQSGSKKLITPMLLRCAYRRTAAIVVDDGRHGIDWLIPVRLKDDIFVALVGQDKNRYGDTPKHLVAISTEESHFKLTTDYFLTAQEKDAFQKYYEGNVGRKGLNWPAILFAIGASEIFTGFAKGATRMVLRPRSRDPIQCFSYPCIVTTGLEYENLMSAESNSALQELCNFHIGTPESYRRNVPLTNGIQGSTEDETSVVEEDA